MSVAVISLVVWLVLVFLSVTAGIEKNWLAKLTSLYAPLRISPTEKYYRSYFYQIDSLASASNYSMKTIGEKREAPLSDPYSESTDAEIPFYWTKPDLKNGNLLDPVKIAVNEMESLKKDFPDLVFQDYEISGALLKLELEREGRVSSLSQMSYLLSMPDENPRFAELLLPPPANAEYHAALKEGKIILPEGRETGILVPKSYFDSGVRLGDRGYLAYSIPSAASVQEQRLPIRVAGFYDPGFLSLGNRCLIVPNHITRMIYASTQTYSPDGTPTNGFFLWPQKGDQIESLKNEIKNRFEQAGISDYWRIATFEEYEFSKDLLQQFRSDRTLFTLIAAIILLVACCNIISLLVLLVNDKKREIAILQSMGASFKSIAVIFALCGTLMGLLSCLFGGLFALFTLRNLSSLVSFLSSIQGRSAFNPAFFGQS
ncbi:MAG TPA: FtsX-like permease family protein, partial [Chlamydiales bacterium]|nr:FtsX-like permease family protein [Chlamydiales bacterium]